MYQHFVEYLNQMHREPEPLVGLGCAFAAGVIGLAMLSPWAAGIVLPIGVISLIVWHHVRKQRMKRVWGFVPKETVDWYTQLQRFKQEKQLESRSHPELIPELEACAELRASILRTLESADWKKLAKQQGWDHVDGMCREVAEDLMVDAVWASKPLFRALGGRKSTFEARGKDPAHTSRPLTAVRLARTQLEKLLDDVSDFPMASLRTTDALARARVEMESLKAAEQEIHRSW